MKNEKKVYVEPEVTKVKFDFSDRIAASSECSAGHEWADDPMESYDCFD